MISALHVAAPPAKPLVVFDGDCHFCTLWIKRWRQITGERVDYLPFQDATIAERFPEIPRAQFEKAVQLIETDGRVFSAANAALRALAKNPSHECLWRLYASLQPFARMAEWTYRLVASHRPLFSAL